MVNIKKWFLLEIPRDKNIFAKIFHIQVALAIRGFGIRGFDYSRT